MCACSQTHAQPGCSGATDLVVGTCIRGQEERPSAIRIECKVVIKLKTLKWWWWKWFLFFYFSYLVRVGHWQFLSFLKSLNCYGTLIIMNNIKKGLLFSLFSPQILWSGLRKDQLLGCVANFPRSGYNVDRTMIPIQIYRIGKYLSPQMILIVYVILTSVCWGHIRMLCASPLSCI